MMAYNSEIGRISDELTPEMIDDTSAFDVDIFSIPPNQEFSDSNPEDGGESKEDNYNLREQEILGRIRAASGYLKSRLKEAAQVGSAALVMGLSNPAFAETPVSSLPLTVEISAQSKEGVPLPTYKEAKARLHSSILTAPAEEVGYFVRTKPDEAMRTVILKKGESVSVGTTKEEFEHIKALIVSRQADVEMVHTHPLSAVEQIGHITHEEAEKVRSGERPHFSFAPSSTDWIMLISDDDIYGYPPGQWSNRVIDTAGEWEYGISDSSAPFIRSLRNFSKETSDIEQFGYSQDEKAYIEKLNDEHKESYFVIQELNKRQYVDPIANAIIAKISQHIERSAKKSEVLEVDANKFAELCEPFNTNMDPHARNQRILRMQELATSLGFHIRYIPNMPATEASTEHTKE